MIWLIGAGGMSVDYAKVLEAQSEKFIVIGRGQNSAKSFQESTGKSVITGGLKTFLSSSPNIPKAAIVSVGVDDLYNSAMHLLKYGVKHILVEKPGGILAKDIESLKNSCDSLGANIYIAYNRRFFSSVLKTQELIESDGGVTSFNFELTEWAHEIEQLEKSKDILATWFLGNTTHVADLAFFLGGKPQKISSYTSGGIDWHPSSSIFAGAGISESGALFNYGADWCSAGRWSVEILTKENRYILRPMESLSIQKRGTIQQTKVEIDDELDKEYKPGLYLQIKAFLANDTASLCSISEQFNMFSVYKKMANYS